MLAPRFTALLVLALVSSPFLSKSLQAGTDHWHNDKEHWKLHWQHRNLDDDDEYDHEEGGCFLGPRDVRLVSDYFMKRFRPLPPGIAKKYYQPSPLPAGWKSQLASIPPALDSRLRPLPDGYRRAVVGGSVIVYDPAAALILDTVILFGR